jgi:hypothetical protein
MNIVKVGLLTYCDEAMFHLRRFLNLEIGVRLFDLHDKGNKRKIMEGRKDN